MTTAERYVKDWARKAREATAARDRWMLTMQEEGASVRHIAQAAGLPHTTVDRILRKLREAEQ
jgi:DNA-binding IscR family transcriptional regulator